MANKQQIRRRHNARLNTFEHKLQTFKAFTGNHSGTILVPNRPGFIYVRDWVGVVHEVYNTVVPTDKEGYLVEISADPRNPNLLLVTGMLNPYIQQTDGGTSLDPKTLEWPNANTIWIQGPQIVPALVIAIGGMVVAVYPFWMRTVEGKMIYVDYQEIDLTSYIPATGAVWAVISFKPDGTSDVDIGGSAASLSLLMSQATQLTVDPSYMSLAAVALFAEETEIIQNTNENHIADLRWTANFGGDMFTATYDTDGDGVVDNSEQLGGHPLSDFVLTTDLFDDSEGAPDDVSEESSSNGTSEHAARHDHVHFAEQNTGHEHTLARWVSDGGDTFEFPDYVDVIEIVTLDGLGKDAALYSLSSDGSQIVFDGAVTIGVVVQSNYIPAQIG